MYSRPANSSRRPSTSLLLIWIALTTSRGDSLYYALNMDHFYRVPPQYLSAVFGTNLLGDALRDLLDPRERTSN